MSQNNAKLNELATRPLGRLLWEYSMPAVVAMLVMQLYNVIDRVFIGQGVGSDAIAGLTITFPVMNLSAAIGILVGAGASAKISILLGQRDYNGAKLVMGNSLVLLLANAIVYLSFFWIFIDEILLAFGASETSLPYARDFMLYILPGMLVMNLTFSFNSIMRSTGYPVKAMVSMFIGAGSNLVLAPIFIFVLDMGIKGAAIATDIAMTISMVFVMSHFFKKDSVLHFERGIYRLKWRIVVGTVAIGAAPSFVQAAGCAISGIINTTVYNYGGDTAVAAVGIFVTYTTLIVSVVVGMCQGLQPILGYNYGAGRIDRLGRAFWLAVWASTIICTIGCLFGLFFPDYIARMFSPDQNLIDATANGLSIAMLSFWFVGFQVIATTLFQSLDKAAKAIFLSLIRQVIFLIPFLLIFPGFIGLNGVWASFPASDICATVMSGLMVWWQMRALRREQRLRQA
jgi:putative MATE family efflux protein